LAKAAELEARAAELKRLAADVRTAAVVAEFEKLAGPNVEKIDLLRAALTIARLDEEDLEVDAYVKYVDRMADEIKKKLPAEATEGQKVSALNDYLFRDNGFHGSRTDYYHRANSYLSRVIDDREGLPITLSVLYIELGSRLGLKIEGVGLPAHFVVRHVPAEGEPQLIDVFEGGEFLSREAAEKKIRELTGEPPLESHFAAVTDRQILMRILTNLIGNAQQPQKGPDREALIRYESAMLALDPALVRDRGLRAVCRWETGRTAAAVADLQVILDAQPDGIDLEELRKMRDYFRANKPPR
jgi:regulator of sirC expression with transglutaminase-like and TPR domain